LIVDKTASNSGESIKKLTIERKVKMASKTAKINVQNCSL